jgi:hypothetical protein
MPENGEGIKLAHRVKYGEGALCQRNPRRIYSIACLSPLFALLEISQGHLCQRCHMGLNQCELESVCLCGLERFICLDTMNIRIYAMQACLKPITASAAAQGLLISSVFVMIELCFNGFVVT